MLRHTYDICKINHTVTSGELQSKFVPIPVVILVVLLVQWLSIGLVIERSLVRLLSGALSSQLGQLSLPWEMACGTQYEFIVVNVQTMTAAFHKVV